MGAPAANAVVVGNAARTIDYVQTAKATVMAWASTDAVVDLGVGVATLHNLRLVRDTRGDLSVGEFDRDLPFRPARYFLVFNVPNGDVRGEHAHKTCHQFLVCVRGSCTVLLDDGRDGCEVTLDRPNLGVFIPDMVWRTILRFSSDAVLLVLASEPYDADDYIRTYSEFRSLALDSTSPQSRRISERTRP